MAKRAARLLIDAVGDQASQKVVDAIVIAVREKDDERLSFLGEVQTVVEAARWKAASAKRQVP
ncbi:hypothetical protein [Sphingopyxis sp. C-1]|uniref:hypothetical protein n=1 Tax=Sphingopyxis sp. C-1 TaxID=262667 RepID=UPI000B0546A3|nr:hypothetical protein [Sphingopyxis sp. C-1]